MKILFLTIFSIFILQCSAYQPVVKSYQDTSLKKEQIAVLYGHEDSEFFVSFSEYTRLPGGKAKQYVSGLTKKPIIVHMLPASYLIKLECLHRKVSRISVNPSIKMDLKAGMTYQVHCLRAPNTKNKIIAYVSSKEKTKTLDTPLHLQ